MSCQSIILKKTCQDADCYVTKSVMVCVFNPDSEETVATNENKC